MFNKKLIDKIREDTEINVKDVWNEIENGVSKDEQVVFKLEPKKRRVKGFYKYATAVACFVIVVVMVGNSGLFAGMKLANKSLSSNFDYNGNNSGLHYAVTSTTQAGVTNASKSNSNSVNEAKDDEYAQTQENGYVETSKEPVSTFSIDVDTASYSMIRNFISKGETVPSDAVRIEEMLNYFKYNYKAPTGNEPFAVNTEISDCPWKLGNKLLMVGIQGKEVDIKDIPSSNLVFLIDVSGSMSDENKLPLIKKAFALLTENLRENDRISVVTYAGADSVVLRGTSGSNQMKINNAINSLDAGGSTAGADGLKTAYEIASEYFIKGGNNRIILATDGDFNVGVSSENELKKLIESERDRGIYLSVMGFGEGNIKDNKMQTLADNGNGNYSYIDNELEAKKVLVEEMGGTLLTIAKDVKLQMTFSNDLVQSYRLIGYENRMLDKQDFSNDAKDAGELGAGHRVTAVYEIVPRENSENAGSGQWATLDLRYKKPNEDKSKLLSVDVSELKYSKVMSDNLAFASSVIEFGLLLKNSKYKENASYFQAYNRIKNLNSIKNDPYKLEFLSFLKKYSD